MKLEWHSQSHMAQERFTFKNVLLFQYATLQMFAPYIRTRINLFLLLAARIQGNTLSLMIQNENSC